MTAPLPALPDGFTARPLSVEDAQIVATLLADCEEFDDGARLVTPGDIRAAWNRPEVDLAAHVIGAFSGDRIVASGEVFEDRVEIDVHPSFRGRGIGSALLPWSWAQARAQGATSVGQMVSDRRTDAAELFRAHGYVADRTAWDLEMPLEDVGEPAFPPGYEVRDLDYAADAREVHGLIRAAFGEWTEAGGASFEEWDGFMGSHPSLAPWASPVLRHEGRVVGVAIGFDYGREQAAWIQQLAVAKEHRDRGLGRALIETSFARFEQRGYGRGGLATDSRSGALALYEHVGMQVRFSYTRWTKLLTP